jgi:hypothetical protein
VSLPVAPDEIALVILSVLRSAAPNNRSAS